MGTRKGLIEDYELEAMLSANTELTQTQTDGVKVNVLYKSDEKLEYIRGKASDCIDLYLAENTIIRKGESKLLNLGVVIEVPKGLRLNLIPRSSTFKKYGLIQTNSIGIIDNSYSGSNDIIRMPVFAPLTSDDVKRMIDGKEPDYTILRKGTRIAQIELVEVLPMSIVEVKEEEWVRKEDRGGFGSTGI